VKMKEVLYSSKIVAIKYVTFFL